MSCTSPRAVRVLSAVSSLAPVALAAAIFVAAWTPTAQAQSRAAGRPDFQITKASFDGRSMHVEYVNATGVGYPRVRYEVGFQWYDASGRSVGERHWLPVPEVERGGVAILDTKYRIDLTYRRSGSNYNRRLLDFILQRPNAAEELRVTVDDGDRVSETNESNNVASLRIPLPDLQITGAKFLSPNRLELSYRNANPSPIPLPFRIGFTWAEEGGTYANATRWINVLEPRDGATETVVLSRTDASYITPQGRQAGDRLDWYFERRPGNATRLQVTMDDAGTVREQNEQNNLVSVRPFLPDLVVRDARLDGVVLSFTYGNGGEGLIRDIASRVVFQWLDGNGQPIGSPRWSGFAQFEPRQVLTVRGDRFDVQYAVPGTNRVATQRLTAYLADRPQDAMRFRIQVDDEQRIRETDEANNAVTLELPPPARPDLTITDAMLTTDALRFTVRNAGEAAVPSATAISLWFEWVDANGARVGQLAWRDFPIALPSRAPLTINGANIQFTRERAGGGTENIGVAELLAGAPDTATHLKLHADGPNTIRESDEANNVVLLPKPVVPRADLHISDFSMDPVAPRAGERVWFTVRVENVGNATTGQPTSTSIILDPDAVSRKIIGGQFTTEIIPAGKSATVRWKKENYYGWVAVEGAQTIEVCADRSKVIVEADETNNCARKTVTVPAPEPPKQPDFAFSVLYPVTYTTEKGLTFTYENIGDQFPDKKFDLVIELRWLDVKGNAIGAPYEITDHGEFRKLGFTHSYGFNAGNMPRIPFFASIPADAAQIRITLDSTNAVAEQREDNNAAVIARPLKPVEPSKSDLMVSGVEVSDGALHFGARNVGTADAKATDAWLMWFGAKGALPSSGAVDLPAIAAGSTAGITVPFNASTEASRILRDPPPDGTQLRIFLDGSRKVEEANEQNNDAYLDRARIPALPKTPAKAPDLAVTMFAIPPNSSLIAGMENSGTAPTGPFVWQLRWLDAKGQPIGAAYRNQHPGLSPKWRFGMGHDSQDTTGKPVTMKQFVTNPPDGAALLEFVLDPDNAIVESDESNNRRTFDGWRVLVPKPKPEPVKPSKPDLVVERISVAPAKPSVGDALTFSAVVKNVGGSTAGESVAYVVLDIGNDGDPEEAPDPVDVPAIAAGAAEIVTWVAEDSAVSGTHVLEVCADVGEEVAEANEENNCRTQSFTVAAKPRTSLLMLPLRLVLDMFSTPIRAGSPK